VPIDFQNARCAAGLIHRHTDHSLALPPSADADASAVIRLNIRRT
jgi:hypothetical protein